jgi:hypothetical protein
MISELVRARMARLALLLAVLCGLLLDLTPPAFAQAKDEGAYKELIEQALSEFKLKNWPEARVLFRKAHELNPNARTLRGMGVVSFEMRDYVQAVQALSTALVDVRQPLTDAQRSECEGLLARARTFVGSYQVRLDPATAQLSLDGAPPLRDQEGLLLVPFGDHNLRASADGYADAVTHLQVQGGERAELSLLLVPAAHATAAPPPAEAPVNTPSAVPQPSQPSAPAEAQGFKGGGLRYTWVALGATAVFGGAAAGLWYAGQGKLDDLDARCARRAEKGNPCEKGSTDTDTVKRFERLSNSALGLTAAALVATGVLAALEWPRERNLSLEVGLQSVSLRGSF